MVSGSASLFIGDWVWGSWGPLLLQADVGSLCPKTGTPSRWSDSCCALHPQRDKARVWQWMSCWECSLIPLPFFFSRKKKKILKEQRKQRERVELKMDLPGVSIADDGDTSMFSLQTIQRTQVCDWSSPGSQWDRCGHVASRLKLLTLLSPVLQLLNEVARGDMASADALLEMRPGDDDICVSDADDEDDVSLASDLDPEELVEIEARQRRLERERREQGVKR